MAESWYDGVVVSPFSKSLMPLVDQSAWQTALAVTAGAPINILGDILSLRGVSWTGTRPSIVHLVDNWYPFDGGGTFRWDPTSTAADNGATVIKEAATLIGRWIRQVTGEVDARWWGVSASNADNTTALQAAVNSGFSSIKLPDGNLVTGAFTIDTPDVVLYGSAKAVLVRKVGVNTNLILINAAGARCKLFGFTINGQRTLQTYLYNTGEITNFGAYVSIAGVRIVNSISMGIRGLNGATGMSIIQCTVDTCGDSGIFINNVGTGVDPSRCIIENCTVENFGIDGGGGGIISSLGIGVRSVDGGTRIINNVVSNVTSYANDQLGIECWTNSNRAVVTGNVIDMATGTAGDFGLSVTGYRSVISNNIISGTTSYGIEIVDAACTATGNVVSKPLGAGIAVNINPGHSNPGDTTTITGNTVEDCNNTTNASFAAIVVDGISGPLPRAITISGNTLTGLARMVRIGSMVSSYTISGNTMHKTGGTLAFAALSGSRGSFIGNTLSRADVAGVIGQAISVSGSSMFISGNHGSFKGTTTAAGVNIFILINAGATDVAVIDNHGVGLGTQYVFSNATAASISVIGGAADAGSALQPNNRAVNVLITSSGMLQNQNAIPNLPNLTVLQLSTAPVAAGSLAFATDGRKAGEGPGTGTGVAAYRDSAGWRGVDTSTTLAS